MTKPACNESQPEQGGEAAPQPVDSSMTGPQRHLSVAPDPLPEEEGDVLAEADTEETELPHPRKDNEDTVAADSAADTDQPGAPDAAAGSAGFGERLREWAAQLVMSPELVTQQRPSLRQVYHYARWSPYIPSGGVARALMLAHVWGVALPTVAACYSFAWAVERPARFYPAAALVAVIAISMSLWMPTRLLLTVLLAPVHFAGMATDALTEW